MAKIVAERPTVRGEGGSIEFVCTVSVGPQKDKKKATAKVLLEAVGVQDPTSASVATRKNDFTIAVECRGSYEWPYEVDTNHFQSLDLRNIICQPIYTAALIKVRELLNLIGVGALKLPYDIRSASQQPALENEAPRTSEKPLLVPAKKRRVKSKQASK
jgi:hypothetical protein